VNCEISEIRKGAFSGLRNLLHLDLSSNLIRAIDDGALGELESLQELSLVSNRKPAGLFVPTPRLLSGLTHLKTLSLTDGVDIRSMDFKQETLDTFFKDQRDALIELDLTGTKLRMESTPSYAEKPKNIAKT
jgi:Leucine-rich repeat (LRR) protein